jgi:hypothetical protein
MLKCSRVEPLWDESALRTPRTTLQVEFGKETGLDGAEFGMPKNPDSNQQVALTLVSDSRWFDFTHRLCRTGGAGTGCASAPKSWEGVQGF